VRFLLQKGEADAVALDGGLVYTAGVCGLVPVMAERYDGECSPAGGTGLMQKHCFYSEIQKAALVLHPSCSSFCLMHLILP